MNGTMWITLLASLLASAPFASPADAYASSDHHANAATRVMEATCAKFSGAWLARGDVPYIFKLNGDCQGTYNLCGVNAKLEAKDYKPGSTHGSFKARVIHSEDPAPACPKPGLEFECTFDVSGKDTLTARCSNFPSAIFDRAMR